MCLDEENTWIIPSAVIVIFETVTFDGPFSCFVSAPLKRLLGHSLHPVILGVIVDP